MKKNIFFLAFVSITTFVFFRPGFSMAQKPSSKPDLKELVLIAGDKKEIVNESQLESMFSVKPTLRIDSGEKPEIENTHYCPTDIIVCRMLASTLRMSSIRQEIIIFLDKKKVEEFISGLSEKMNIEPVNAKFKMEDNGLVNFIPSTNGLAIDYSKSVDIIMKELTENSDSISSREIILPYEVKEPKIKSSEANDLGINTLIGEGKSNFRGSPKNRMFNINVATEKFNGVLIPPGEEFSFVKTLGPVDGEHGYAPELVIKQDKTEPEFGGGICQVSTTAFRAAINSGFKITARRNHAYPVAYYNPQGMDATVYIPRPDLKFINNTPGYVLIQTKIEGTALIFQLFGTDDGRKVEIDGPHILERNPDGSMKTVFTQTVYDKDGNKIINDVFKSSYESPSKFPHPGEQKLTKKPSGWSDKEWKKYKATNGL